jgi:predicted deacylase
MSHSELLRMTAPMREDFSLACHDLGDPDRPPRAALVAGIHGNEINGIFVLARLAAYLGRVEAGELPGHLLCERVIVIPGVNVLGINTRSRGWPFDGTDINRMFPGYEAGETTQRLAAAVLEATRPAYYRIDIHSSNLDFEELPQVRLYDPHDDERASAGLMGLPAVIERPVNLIHTSTLTYAWRHWGGENFVIQAGQAGNLQRQHSERLFRGLVGFLLRTEILEAPELSEEEEDLHYFGPEQEEGLVSEHAGMFVSMLDVGRWVQRGETIGHVYDSFDGGIHAELRAPVSGLLTGLRRQPLLCQGDLVARIHTRKAEGRRGDAHLHHAGQ